MSSETSHADIARRFLHERSDVGDPRLSPDGTRIAHVVATCDLDENTTNSRVWLDGAPVTAGPYDGQPRWSHDGRWLAFTSRRGEKKGDATLHVIPTVGPGEVRTICTLPEAITNVAWSPDGRHLAFVSRTRDERYDAKDESWQAPRKIERYGSRLNGENWVFDRPAHVYVVSADGTGAPRNLTPGAFQHSDVSWLPDSSGVVTVASRHDTWDLDLAIDLYLASGSTGRSRPSPPRRASTSSRRSPPTARSSRSSEATTRSPTRRTSRSDWCRPAEASTAGSAKDSIARSSR